MAKISPAVVVMNGVMKVPNATSDTPSSNTRPAPTRSAKAPANGCVSPHHNCPNAKARLIPPTPKPVAVFSELRNKPMVWRTPMVRAKVPAAANSTNQTASGLRAEGAEGAVEVGRASDIVNSSFTCVIAVNFFFWGRQQRQGFLDKGMQGHHALYAQGLV